MKGFVCRLSFFLRVYLLNLSAFIGIDALQ